MRGSMHLTLCALVLMLGFSAAPARAQSPNGIGVRGFALVGNMTFTAKESFDTILDTHSGPIYGGGGTVLLPWDFYVEVRGTRFRRDGQRVFIGPNDEVFKLGIPVEITITPVELTGGYRLTRLSRRFVPYGGAGYSSSRYKETSQFADAAENVDDRFTGFHVLGGAEYLPFRWLAVGGEVGWSSIANAIGASGVSQHFNEDNIGGTSARLKISVGR
jgi:opacity protein-like surface antigen